MTTSGLRADARRNREQLLVAARDVFVEQGVDAPLDDVARRAGVGIATLYRRFPDRNTDEDGFITRAPVESFPPNGYGLFEMTGNVWEWCADLYADDYYANSPVNDPQGPGDGKERSIRGGSWMCAENFCTNYRVAARSHATPDSGLNNLGFRCVRDE
jgi:formylglycine-generating enzyme required for sulfatase activity